MEQQLIQTKSGELVVVIGEEVNCLKDILLYSRSHYNEKVLVKVPRSRFLKILSDYWAINAINIEDGLEVYSKYKSYILSNLDDNGNIFKILRLSDKLELEVKGKCDNCNCGGKRWIDKKTGNCYYNKMINENYTTKIK